jgi:hypothetical protein
MGCSNSFAIETIINKSFYQLTNFYTINKYEPNLLDNYGILSVLELDNDRFLVLVQYDKILIYDSKNFEVIHVMSLESSANSIIKFKNDKYIFGGDDNKLSLLEIGKNSYKILSSISCGTHISKILKNGEEIIASSYNNISFYNLNNKNEFILKNTINNTLDNSIFNIYVANNLLLSLMYGLRDVKKNELIIYDLNDNNKIVHKEEKASIMPWNNSVCNFNSELLIISGNDLGIRIFEIKTFKILTQIKGLDFFYSVFSQGNKIFCGGNSGKIYEFEYNSNNNELKLIKDIKIHESSIFSITKISSGSIVTTSRDGTIKFFR